MNHRLVQRTLFRMQLDPGFAARLRSAETDAAPDEAKELGPQELALLRDADAHAIAADRDGKRRAQFLANVSSEFPLSNAGGLEAEGFTTSAEFHAAVREDTSLPVAFARYAMRCSLAEPAPLRALIALEVALAHARREVRDTPSLAPGELVLAGSVTLIDVAGGTLLLASNQRAALDAGMALPILLMSPAPDETLLVRSSPASNPFRLRDVAVEHVSPALASLLRETRRPCSRATLGGKLAIAPDDLASIVDELVADGILLER